MDRSFWLSLMAVGLAIALLFTGRAALDTAKAFEGSRLVAEIENLEGTPSSVDLAIGVTDAAGCIYGVRPRVRSCWYVWADPSHPDYLMVVAERVRSDATSSAVSWAAGAFVFWLLAIITAWGASRPKPPLRLRPISPPVRIARPPGRLTPWWPEPEPERCPALVPGVSGTPT